MVVGAGVFVFLVVTALLGSKYLFAKDTTGELTQKLVKKVASHIPVNLNEIPTVAIVKDENLVRTKNPVFYKDAKNGDRVLIWTNQAVLYSEAEDKVRAVLPVQVIKMVDKPVPFKETSVLEIRNGSGINGAGKAAVSRLSSMGFSVLPAEDAKAKTIYPHTIIMKGNDRSLPMTALILEKLIGSVVTSTSLEESPAKGDFLIILGSDFKK